MRHAVIAAAILTSTIAIGSSFAAVSDDREATMKNVMASFKVLVGISKSGKFDAAEAKARGTAIAADLEKFKDLFPDGSQNADNKALPQIWSDRPGFEAARNKAREAALSLASSQDFTTFKAGFDALAAGCKGCHDSYRAK
jgi:cytochrome c556